jgi:3-carboxy-cis,cis-muconate cycloisomerase
MLLEPQFRTREADLLWSAEARLARMLRFEQALAGAQHGAGLIPRQSLAAILAVGVADLGEAEAVFAAAGSAGNPAIPFVQAFTRAVQRQHAPATAHAHLGATSQDVIDTATALALAEVVEQVALALDAAAAAAMQLARRHGATPMVARTLLQHATPITFGLKAALWGRALAEARAALLQARHGELCVQLAGAVGSLHALHPHGASIRRAVAEALGLADPGASWHTDRQGPLRLAAALVAACGTAAKVAGDIMLLMQSEVGEAAEAAAPGKGGSSAMPHKRNPVDALVPAAALPVASALLGALAASQPHAHERAAGPWHAEWMVWPLLTTLVMAAAARLAALLEGLSLESARMAATLAGHHGLLASEALAAALAPTLGREAAHERVQALAVQALEADEPFETVARRVMHGSGALGAAVLDDVFGYSSCLNAASAEAARLVAEWEAARG